MRNIGRRVLDEKIEALKAKIAIFKKRRLEKEIGTGETLSE